MKEETDWTVAGFGRVTVKRDVGIVAVWTGLNTLDDFELELELDCDSERA